MRRLRTPAATVVLAAAIVTGPGALTPARADAADCSGIQGKTDTSDASPSDDDTAASEPLTAMGIYEFQQAIEDRGATLGGGIGVAVVDSGVHSDRGFKVAVPHGNLGTPTTPSYYHGTAVAGLIAGQALRPDRPVGIAPDASIIDYHFYDQDNSGDSATSTTDGVSLTPKSLAAALQAVAQTAKTYKIRIVNVSLGVDDYPALKAAVTRLTSMGIIVVASSGNRPQQGGFPGGYDTPKKGEDAADAVFPAGYAVHNPRVIAVGSTVTGDDSTDQVLPNSAIDVVTPTQDAVSYGLNGMTCGLGDQAATSWSAAYVTGVLADLMSAFPKDNTDQVVARLEATATGQPKRTDIPADLSVGRGIIQPLEALTRPLSITKRGAVKGSSLPRSTVQPVPLPEPEPDVLASTRHHALWWGLSGFGALLVAVTLRPVLARRRR